MRLFPAQSATQESQIGDLFNICLQKPAQEGNGGSLSVTSPTASRPDPSAITTHQKQASLW